jgi:protein-S-isoprenylcysteine O-methyltransferase Ste14
MLVVSGLYRHVRNPIYLGLLVVIVGQALVLGDERLFAYAGLLFAALHVFVVRYEEPKLAARFGEQYWRYWDAVGRWLPRVSPWRGEQPPPDVDYRNRIAGT